jgi:hypothetical protein
MTGPFAAFLTLPLLAAGFLLSANVAYLEHEQAKIELKSLLPQDAKEAIGHGIRAKRSKSGAVKLRPPRSGRQSCSSRVNPLPAWPLHWRRRRRN